MRPQQRRGADRDGGTFRSLLFCTFDLLDTTAKTLGGDPMGAETALSTHVYTRTRTTGHSLFNSCRSFCCFCRLLRCFCVRFFPYLSLLPCRICRLLFRGSCIGERLFKRRFCCFGVSYRHLLFAQILTGITPGAHPASTPHCTPRTGTSTQCSPCPVSHPRRPSRGILR